MDTDYAESLLHSLEQASRGIGLHVKASKTEYMSFKWEGAISTLNDGPLKVIDKFSYLGSSISSTESDVHMRLAKAWIAIDHMEIWSIR